MKFEEVIQPYVSSCISLVDYALTPHFPSATQLDIEELTVENALFESFGGLVRAQLAPVWDKVGAKTKGLVADLKTLRGFQQ